MACQGGAEAVQTVSWLAKRSGSSSAPARTTV
ncbi:Uncharacterised protein [Bordetella pertussis]|nr:Uncharacterised protein [Bordetella pertussis]